MTERKKEVEGKEVLSGNIEEVREQGGEKEMQ